MPGTQWTFSKCKPLYLFILLIQFGYLYWSSLTCLGLALLEVSSDSPVLANPRSGCWGRQIRGWGGCGWGVGPSWVDRGWAWSLNQDLSQGSELDSNRKVSVLLLANKEKDLNSTLLGYVTWRRIHLLVKAGHPSPIRWT